MPRFDAAALLHDSLFLALLPLQGMLTLYYWCIIVPTVLGPPRLLDVLLHGGVWGLLLIELGLRAGPAVVPTRTTVPGRAGVVTERGVERGPGGPWRFPRFRSWYLSVAVGALYVAFTFVLYILHVEKPCECVKWYGQDPEVMRRYEEGTLRLEDYAPGCRPMRDAAERAKWNPEMRGRKAPPEEDHYDHYPHMCNYVYPTLNWGDPQLLALTIIVAGLLVLPLWVFVLGACVKRCGRSRAVRGAAVQSTSSGATPGDVEVTVLGLGGEGGGRVCVLDEGPAQRRGSHQTCCRGSCTTGTVFMRQIVFLRLFLVSAGGGILFCSFIGFTLLQRHRDGFALYFVYLTHWALLLAVVSLGASAWVFLAAYRVHHSGGPDSSHSRGSDDVVEETETLSDIGSCHGCDGISSSSSAQRSTTVGSLSPSGTMSTTGGTTTTPGLVFAGIGNVMLTSGEVAGDIPIVPVGPARSSSQEQDDVGPAARQAVVVLDRASVGPLEGLSAVFRRGEMNAIVGESGAGKSTLCTQALACEAPCA